MPYPRKLPDWPTLRRLYVDEGRSFGWLAKEYGVHSANRVRETMKRDALKRGVPWPLKKGTAGWEERRAASIRRHQHDAVKSDLVRMEIQECREVYSITLGDLAERSGVDENTLSRIANGDRPWIQRKTAEAIMSAISEIERVMWRRRKIWEAENGDAPWP